MTCVRTRIYGQLGKTDPTFGCLGRGGRFVALRKNLPPELRTRGILHRQLYWFCLKWGLKVINWPRHSHAGTLYVGHHSLGPLASSVPQINISDIQRPHIQCIPLVPTFLVLSSSILHVFLTSGSSTFTFTFNQNILFLYLTNNMYNTKILSTSILA